MRSGEAKSTKYLRENLFLFSPSMFQVNEVTFTHEGVEDPKTVEAGGDKEARASTMFLELSDPIILKRLDLWKEFQEQNHLQKLLNQHYQ